MAKQLAQVQCARVRRAGRASARGAEAARAAEGQVEQQLELQMRQGSDISSSTSSSSSSSSARSARVGEGAAADPDLSEAESRNSTSAAAPHTKQQPGEGGSEQQQPLTPQQAALEAAHASLQVREGRGWEVVRLPGWPLCLLHLSYLCNIIKQVQNFDI